MDFNSQLTTISDDVLSQLFSADSGDTSNDDGDKSGGAGTDEGGKPTIPVNDADIPVIEDLDSLETEEAEDKNDDDKSDDKPADDKSDDSDDNSKKDKVDPTKVNEVLKSTTEYLIEKGIWSDFEGREETEVTEELYAQIAEAQASNKVQELFEELVDSTGDYGKAIITHIKNGGNPDEIIDIFKEQKAIEAVDITQGMNAENLIEKYYKEEVGWSDVKIKKWIDGLKAEESGLEDEANDIKSKYQESYKKQLEQVQKQQQLERAEAQRRHQEYMDSLSSEIESFEGFTTEDKKLVKEAVFKTKKVNGIQVSPFVEKISEIQKNPKEFIEFVHFVMNKEGYKSKIGSVKQKEVTEKTWNFVKGNSAVKNSGSSSSSQSNKKEVGTNFSGIVFKK